MIVTGVYIVILLWATWCVFSQSVKDGILGRIMYSSIAIAAFAAIFSEHALTIYRSNQIVVVAVACIGLRHFFMKMLKSHRKPRT